MASLKTIELEVEGTKDLALISLAIDSVWLVVPLRWWDLSTLIWWFFAPADKKARVRLTLHGGEKVSFPAIRVASRHVHVRGFQ
jgi:hypothetical protein